MKKVKNIFVLCLIVMFLVTFTCSLMYLVAQQSLRLGANELPSQLAIETSIKLQNGQSVKDAVSTEKVDISKSLNAFVMVYDSNKSLIATSGIMDNNDPVYPKGVFDIRVNLESHGSQKWVSVFLRWQLSIVMDILWLDVL